MTAARRWCLVLVGVIAVITAPAVMSAWPVDGSQLSATQLVERVRGSQEVAYTGYVESVSGIALPTTDEFGEVADLFGGVNRARVWWAGPYDWRVDELATAGETDLYRAGDLTYEWDYESFEASVNLAQLAVLPRTVDLLPPQLADRVLSEARPEELTRLPAERVAGHDAPGVRLTPSPPQSSIDHVDVWVEPESGIALRVEVWGEGDRTPAVSSRFLDVSLAAPDAGLTTFTAPPGADVLTGGTGGDSLVSHIPAVFAAPRLAGLPQAADPTLVARYGRGVTQLLVIGLDDEVADPLRDQLASTAGRVVDPELGTSLAAGPLHVLLTPCQGEAPSWLLVGTVDDATLTAAAGVAVRQQSGLPLAGLDTPELASTSS